MTSSQSALQIGHEKLVDGVYNQRAAIFQSPLGLVEDVVCRTARVRRSPEGYSPDFQVCLPYRGVFVWHTERQEIVSDPNQILFVSNDQPFHVSQPSGEAAELIITPSQSLLAELLAVSPSGLRSHTLFRGLTRPADLRFQLLRARFLHRARANAWYDLAVEELLVATLRCALRAEAPAPTQSARTQRLIGRAKEFIQANLSEPFLLGDAARAVGASPAYLTDVFRRFEGLPLHKYAMQARLSRALIELPHANDLTSLALDLGFSSHSHFAAAFRRAFGSTPSEFRSSARAYTNAVGPRSRRGLHRA